MMADCEACEAEALQRVQAVRDLLWYVLWGETPPLGAIDAASQGLVNARSLFLAAGHES
jgi:hypothetical protein